MSKPKYVPGGWMDFAQRVRDRVQRPLTDEEVKAVMQLYIKGKKPEDFE